MHLVTPDWLAAEILERSVDLARLIATICSLGISASLLALALFVCGHKNAVFMTALGPSGAVAAIHRSSHNKGILAISARLGEDRKFN
jgi:hypothetical protein